MRSTVVAERARINGPQRESCHCRMLFAPFPRCHVPAGIPLAASGEGSALAMGRIATIYPPPVASGTLGDS